MSARVIQACQTIWKRYANEELDVSLRAEPTGYNLAAWGDALGYLSGVVNRQIIKGNGVLAFNSILLAAIRLSDTGASSHDRWQLAATVAGACACLCVLALFRVDWATAPEYTTIAREFEHTMRLIGKRSTAIDVALYLSGAGIILHVIGLTLRGL